MSTKNLTLLVFTWDLKHSTLERGLKALLSIKQDTLSQLFFFFKLGSDIYNIFVSDHFFLGSL